MVGNYTKNIRHIEITLEDVKVAMCADDILMDLFEQNGVPHSCCNDSRSELVSSQNYDETVRELVNELRQHLREFQMIMKVC